jgi:TonB family protein
MKARITVDPRSTPTWFAVASVFVVVSMIFVQAGRADQTLTLGGVTLGSPVEASTRAFGAPGLVQTTDDGHEWRWFDAAGLDVDLLVDNTLTVRQVLVSRPEDVHGTASKLVQPSEFPVLEQLSSSAATWMKSNGATPQPEPENSVSAWRVAGGLVVLELRDGRVRKILALDITSAAHLGYVSGPKAAPYRSPRLVRQYAVDYPKRAIERRAEGVVVVAVDLASSGSVKSVRVIVSSGDADLDAAEVLSMRRSRFAPARCNGEPCDGIYLDREEYTLAP